MTFPLSEAANPIRLVYEALWDILLASADFVDGVKAGNRINYFGSIRAPDKDILGDTGPAVRILPRGSKPWLQRTGGIGGSSLVLQWHVQVITGDQRADTLFDLKWIVYRALSNWAAQLSALTWQSKTFVVACRAVQVETELGGALDAGILGWNSVWAGEVEMWFSTTDLQA